MTKLPYETPRGLPGAANFRYIGDLTPDNERWWLEFGRALNTASVLKPRPLRK